MAFSFISKLQIKQRILEYIFTRKYYFCFFVFVCFLLKLFTFLCNYMWNWHNFLSETKSYFVIFHNLKNFWHTVRIQNIALSVLETSDSNNSNTIRKYSRENGKSGHFQRTWEPKKRTLHHFYETGFTTNGRVSNEQKAEKENQHLQGVKTEGCSTLTSLSLVTFSTRLISAPFE